MDLDLYCTDLPLSEVPGFARRAENAGFSGLWFGEVSHDPYLASALAATATSGISVGTDIAVAFPRSPMVTAQLAWDLAEVSRGRFSLGLGTQVKGHMERRFSVPFSQPGARVREYIQAVRAIFGAFQGTAPLSFQGDFYSFSLLPEFFSPGPIDHPHLPIYLAGVNAGLARVAGEVCDGYHIHPLHSVEYLRQVTRPAVAEGAAKVGRSPTEVTLVAPVFMIVGDTEEEIERRRRETRRNIAFYGSTRTYQRVFRLHGWGDLPAELHAALAKGDLEAMEPLITDEMLDTFAVTSDWDGLAGTLLQRYEGLVDRVLPYGEHRPLLQSEEHAERWRAVTAAVNVAKGA